MQHLRSKLLGKTYIHFIAHNKSAKSRGEMNPKWEVSTEKSRKLKKYIYIYGSSIYVFCLGDGARLATGAKLHQLCEAGVQDQLPNLDWLGLSAGKVSFFSFNSRAISVTTSFLGNCLISILLTHFLSCVYVIYNYSNLGLEQ